MATATKVRKRKSGQQAPERIVNDSPRTFTDADFPVGSVAHQGDVILVRLAVMPAGVSKPRQSRQVADGTTQGSRHILDGGVAFDFAAPGDVAKAIRSVCPKADVGEQYIGPVFTTPCVLTHPEHGDHHYEFEGVMAVVIQRNLDAEEREQRARD
jgi:hypothetical protein